MRRGWDLPGQPIENVDELVHEGLAFEAEQKMFEINIGQVRRAAGVTPQFQRWDMSFFRLPYSDWTGISGEGT
jgi:hypothetical protein